MEHFIRITVPLGEQEFQALKACAEREYRQPREQARYLLRQALGVNEQSGVNYQELENLKDSSLSSAPYEATLHDERLR